MHLETTRTTFIGLWVFMFLAQVSNTAFLVLLARAYLDFDSADSILNYLSNTFMDSVAILFLRQTHTTVGVGYALIAIPFVYGTLRMLWYSITRRQFAVGPANKRPSKITVALAKQAPQRLLARQDVGIVTRWMRDSINAIGIFGPHFTVFVLAIETFEVVLETVQGYQFSKYISNLQINQAFGLMVFINCCSTPITHYVWVMRRNDVVMGRLVCAVVDIVLDFAWGTVLQGLLFWRYYQYYLGTPYTTTLVNADRELRKILIINNQNFLLSVFPFLSSAYVMYEILEAMTTARIISKQTNTTAATTTTSNAGIKLGATNTSSTSREQALVAASVVTPHVSASNGCAPAPPVPIEADTNTKVSSTPHRHSEPLAIKIFLVLMVLYGVAFLIVSIASTDAMQHTGSATGCKERLYPWFTQDITCVSRQINCQELQISGRKDELTAVLTPEILLHFDGLVFLSMVNVTVVQWDAAVAVSDANYPVLIALTFVLVDFQAIPHGLVDQPLPSQFEFIGFDSVNANTFMQYTDETWSMVIYFYCTNCGFTSLPTAISRMNNLQQLLLHNNAITEIPANTLSAMPDLVWLRLPHNPLVALPQDVWDLMPQLVWMTLQYTNVSTIPADALTASYPSLYVWAYGSPLCDGTVVNPSPSWLQCDANDDAGWF